MREMESEFSDVSRARRGRFARDSASSFRWPFAVLSLSWARRPAWLDAAQRVPYKKSREETGPVQWNIDQAK